jgi:hypothetical protein
LVFLLPKISIFWLSNLLTLSTWFKLINKCIVHTKLDINVFIKKKTVHFTHNLFLASTGIYQIFQFI